MAACENNLFELLNLMHTQAIFITQAHLLSCQGKVLDLPFCIVFIRISLDMILLLSSIVVVVGIGRTINKGLHAHPDFLQVDLKEAEYVLYGYVLLGYCKKV